MTEQTPATEATEAQEGVAAATGTEAQEAPENTAESAVEPPEGTAEVEVPTEANESVSRRDQKLADEAAKWRVTARQTETRLKVAEARVAELQRQEVERILATKLAMPEDMWLSGKWSVADMLNEQGQVDAERVSAAADAVLEGRPHWRATLKPVGAPASSVTGDGDYKPGPAAPTWQQLLRGDVAG